MGAYSAREMFLIGMEDSGELSFKYVKNDGSDDSLKWCVVRLRVAQLSVIDNPRGAWWAKSIGKVRLSGNDRVRRR